MEGGHPKIGAELRQALRRDEQGSAARHRRPSRRRDDRPHLHGAGRRRRRHQRRRPGARRETLEKYVKRLEELEAVASRLPGRRARLRHPGRPRAARHRQRAQTTDADAVKICRDIARAIEEQLNYPGEIKVTVVRETRSVDVAK